ncbi:MAG: sigma 54-interacting transcriptional regulator [Kofleriaceae bacterium]
MPRVRVEVAGVTGEELIEVTEGEVALLGRRPEPTLLVGQRGTVRSQVFASPSVSGNHATVSLHDGQIHLRDLGSRNGSWLRLPDDVSIVVPATHELKLRLGFATGAPVDRTIEPPHYEDRDGFGAAVALQIERWFGHQGIQVQVRASADDEQPAGMVVLPLPTGETITILTNRTLDDHFHDLMVTVARYVSAQGSLFTAEEDTRRDGMILASPAMRLVHRRVVEAALRNENRLILLGPSGTGKERLAHAYHAHLGRSGPLITVNCASLSGDRFVADVFGSEAGAYTDAKRVMVGAVERAHGGTLFLDEIGDLPLEVQTKLLRFLDSGEYQRLGSIGVSRNANVHVVVATNKDLRRMAVEGTFRQDLFYRLAHEIVEVPSLRERFKDAIAYLATYSLGKVSALDALQPAALEVLRRHTWGGNFRELVNLAHRLPSTSEQHSVDVETIQRVLNAGALTPPPLPPQPRREHADWMDWLRDSATEYMASSGGSPATWGEMGTFIEQFLKPYALVHMGGVAGAASFNDVSAGEVATVLKADRGTVLKQVRRYFESRPKR